MLQGLAEKCSQFTVEVSCDRNRWVNLEGFDAVALYLLGGEITPEQEQGLTGFVRRGGGLLAVHASNAG